MPGQRDVMANFQPSQLRAFVMLAKEGSYTRVARLLSYSQPAVHMQVKNLERAVGLPLVRREGQRVVLTWAGRELLPLATKVLEGNEEFLRAVRRLQPGAPLVVGAGRHTGVYVLMPFLEKFRRLTGIVPELHLLPAKDLIEGLVEDRFDLVVAGIPDAVFPRDERIKKGVVRVPWQRDRFVLFAGSHSRPKKTSARPRLPATVFFPDYAVPLRSQLEAATLRLSSHLKLVRLDTAEAVKSAVSYGLGAGVLPAGALEAERATGALEVVAELESGCAHILHKRTRHLSSSARRLVTFLVECARGEQGGRSLPSAIA